MWQKQALSGKSVSISTIDIPNSKLLFPFRQKQPELVAGGGGEEKSVPRPSRHCIRQ